MQAAIADLHTQEQRDWQQIALLYIRLEELTGSPIVTVNRAIALAQIERPAAALALLDDLDLESYLYFHSTRADLLVASATTTKRAPLTPGHSSLPKASPCGASSNHGCPNSTPAPTTEVPLSVGRRRTL